MSSSGCFDDDTVGVMDDYLSGLADSPGDESTRATPTRESSADEESARRLARTASQSTIDSDEGSPRASPPFSKGGAGQWYSILRKSTEEQIERSNPDLHRLLNAHGTHNAMH